MAGTHYSQTLSGFMKARGITPDHISSYLCWPPDAFATYLQKGTEDDIDRIELISEALDLVPDQIRTLAQSAGNVRLAKLEMLALRDQAIIPGLGRETYQAAKVVSDVLRSKREAQKQSIPQLAKGLANSIGLYGRNAETLIARRIAMIEMGKVNSRNLRLNDISSLLGEDDIVNLPGQSTLPGALATYMGMPLAERQVLATATQTIADAGEYRFEGVTPSLLVPDAHLKSLRPQDKEIIFKQCVDEAAEEDAGFPAFARRLFTALHGDKARFTYPALAEHLLSSESHVGDWYREQRNMSKQIEKLSAHYNLTKPGERKLWYICRGNEMPLATAETVLENFCKEGEYGEALKLLFYISGMSNNRAGELCGISRNAIFEWKAGRKSLKPENAQQLIETLCPPVRSWSKGLNPELKQALVNGLSHNYTKDIGTILAEVQALPEAQQPTALMKALVGEHGLADMAQEKLFNKINSDAMPDDEKHTITQAKFRTRMWGKVAIGAYFAGKFAEAAGVKDEAVKEQCVRIMTACPPMKELMAQVREGKKTLGEACKMYRERRLDEKGSDLEANGIDKRAVELLEKGRPTYVSGEKAEKYATYLGLAGEDNRQFRVRARQVNKEAPLQQFDETLALAATDRNKAFVRFINQTGYNMGELAPKIDTTKGALNTGASADRFKFDMPMADKWAALLAPDAEPALQHQLAQSLLAAFPSERARTENALKDYLRYDTMSKQGFSIKSESFKQKWAALQALNGEAPIDGHSVIFEGHTVRCGKCQHFYVHKDDAPAIFKRKKDTSSWGQGITEQKPKKGPAIMV